MTANHSKSGRSRSTTDLVDGLAIPNFQALLDTPIVEPSESARRAVKNRIYQHARPRDSLGKLENLAAALAGMQNTASPSVKPRVALMFCADHGVAHEKVSVFPQDATCNVAAAAVGGVAGINAFANEVGCDVQVIDVGMQRPVPGTVERSVQRSSGNIAFGPAMNRHAAEKCLLAGAQVALSALAKGYRAIVVGEMGNSNTTVASALLSALTGFPVDAVVGRGTGISNVVLLKKTTVVHRALEINRPNSADPVDCLMKVGGLEIGAITGAIIASAMSRTPCVIDGFIASVSAVLATRLRPQVHPYLIFSHLSPERGHALLLQYFNASPLLDLGLCLGEATGAIASLSLLDLSCALIHGIKTFTEAGIPSPYGAEHER